MRNSSDIQETVEFALDSAARHGAENARVTYSKGSETSYSVLQDRIDRLNRSTSASLYIQVFTEGKYGSFSTNRMDRTEIDGFIAKGIETTRLLTEDRAFSLPDKDRYFKEGDTVSDLEQYDPAIRTLDEERKRNLVLDTAAEVYGKDSRLISVTADWNDYEDYVFMADSQGFSGDGCQSSFYLGCECSVRGEGDARPEAWWYESSIFFDDLKKKGCGEKALRRALDRLSPQKIRSGKYTAIVENRIASRLLSPVIEALSGSALHSRNSFLEGSLGKKIFSDRLTVQDRPFEKRIPGARLYDSEGIRTFENDIIHEGTVSMYHINTYFSKKLDMPGTIDGPSVIKMAGNGPDSIRKDAAEMMRSAGKGILITGFNGGNCNGTTGDFSFGIEGFYFENGIILYPIREMNLSGNMIGLWKELAWIGQDAGTSSSWMIPSLTFEHAEFSGI